MKKLPLRSSLIMTFFLCGIVLVAYCNRSAIFRTTKIDEEKMRIERETKMIATARDLLKSNNVHIPEASKPRLIKSDSGRLKVSFLHTDESEPGERRGDDLGSVSFDPVTYKPEQVFGPGD